MDSRRPQRRSRIIPYQPEKLRADLIRDNGGIIQNATQLLLAGAACWIPPLSCDIDAPVGRKDNSFCFQHKTHLSLLTEGPASRQLGLPIDVALAQPLVVGRTFIESDTTEMLFNLITILPWQAMCFQFFLSKGAAH